MSETVVVGIGDNNVALRKFRADPRLRFIELIACVFHPKREHAQQTGCEPDLFCFSSHRYLQCDSFAVPGDEVAESIDAIKHAASRRHTDIAESAISWAAFATSTAEVGIVEVGIPKKNLSTPRIGLAKI